MEVLMTQISNSPISSQSSDPKVEESHKTLTGIIYLLHLLAFATSGITLVIAIATNYVKRNEVKGTWLESHFDWQIKTALIALSVGILGGGTIQVGIGYFFLVGAMLWLMYRIVFGWFRLYENNPVREKDF